VAGYTLVIHPLESQATLTFAGITSTLLSLDSECQYLTVQGMKRKGPAAFKIKLIAVKVGLELVVRLEMSLVSTMGSIQVDFDSCIVREE
jgi:hypothetical protein